MILMSCQFKVGLATKRATEHNDFTLASAVAQVVFQGFTPHQIIFKALETFFVHFSEIYSDFPVEDADINILLNFLKCTSVDPSSFFADIEEAEALVTDVLKDFSLSYFSLILSY